MAADVAVAISTSWPRVPCGLRAWCCFPAGCRERRAGVRRILVTGRPADRGNPRARRASPSGTPARLKAMRPGVLRLSVLAAALCTVAPLAAGCGSSSAPLATGNAMRLHNDVASIRAAVAAHHPETAHAAVRALEADVGRLRAGGMLSSADAGVLLSDAGQVNHRVSLQVHARAPAPASGSAPPPAPATGAARSSGAVESPGANGHGKHGRGRGDGGDGGD